MSDFHVLGIGTLTLTAKEPVGGTANEFAGEVLGAKVTHEYEDVGEARTMLDGTVRPAGKRRTDGLTASIENDLTAAGFYKFLYDNDAKQADIEFVPNTADGAQWVGVVVCNLPSEVGADEFGSPIVSDVELQCVGTLVFTAAGTVVP